MAIPGVPIFATLAQGNEPLSLFDTAFQEVQNYVDTESVPINGSSTINGTLAGDNGVTGNEFVNFSQFGNLPSKNGHQELPGGIVMQWGAVTTDATGEATGAFPMPFPNNLFSCAATVAFDTGLAVLFVNTGRLMTNTTYDFWTNIAAAGTAIYYIAIGN